MGEAGDWGMGQWVRQEIGGGAMGEAGDWGVGQWVRQEIGGWGNG